METTMQDLALLTPAVHTSPFLPWGGMEEEEEEEEENKEDE